GAALQEASAEANLWLDIPVDESLPGFADSVSDGAGFLRTIVGVVLVVVGVLVPFLPFAAVIAALIWWRRRRRRGHTRPEPRPKREPRSKHKRTKTPAPAPAPAPAPDGSDDSS
ncbi:MAG: hypothetical protein OXC00_12710, partial [Acidimicrobiaceae bacterium]|nr:hypothetical protein [Acidimicrobiaceae bacterium]